MACADSRTLALYERTATGVSVDQRNGFCFMPTSKLQRQCETRILETFPYLDLQSNARLNWLTDHKGDRLELDVWLPSLSIAAEIQGEQHFSFIPYFHGSIEEFHAQQLRDETKRMICDKRGVKLFEIIDSQDIEGLLNHLKVTLKTETASGYTLPHGKKVK